MKICLYFHGFIQIYIFITFEWLIKNNFSLINTCCLRADQEIFIHDGEAGVI